MTAEICVANRSAIVLAADSAATVTQWHDGSAKERYYKGANKIFQFSGAEPVGVMIYDSAALHSVPWETIIKECRRKSKDAAFKTLDEYAQHLFEFVEKHLGHVFTAKVRRDDFIVLVLRQFFQMVDLFAEISSFKSATTIAELKAALATIVSDRLADLRKAKPPEGITSDDITKAISEFIDELSADGKDLVFKHATIQSPKLHELTDDASDFWELMIRVTMQRYQQLANMTGVVVAGFGADDFFPGYVHYGCYGFLNDRLAVVRIEASVVDGNNGSKIEAFAQRDMSETFMVGVSPEVLGFVTEATNASLATVSEELEKAGATLPPDWQQRMKSIQKDHRDLWMKKAIDRHWRPLSRVVGSLPIEDMATLAETLVALTSLKERVTKGTETVGGAVDVAVMTRGDGFIWVKRKHYFDPNLNPRYFDRLRR